MPSACDVNEGTRTSPYMYESETKTRRCVEGDGRGRGRKKEGEEFPKDRLDWTGRDGMGLRFCSTTANNSAQLNTGPHRGLRCVSITWAVRRTPYENVVHTGMEVFPAVNVCLPKVSQCLMLAIRSFLLEASG